MPKITKRLIDALPDGRAIIWDSEIKGFGLVVHAGGARSFVVQFRTRAGRKRRLTLGRCGVLTPEQARKYAQEALVRVSKGDDPVADRREERSAPILNELFDRYLSDHVDPHNAPKTKETIIGLLNNHLRPRLGSIKVNALTRADVARVHAALRDTPRTANLALATLSKALNLAE
ncbi:MAG TPA: integrase arm-type DNA-binding domain-containing protein, partial [Methylovirgula sp.]|nr:integrase arm-type DNA-binding domain-containing protein [Methylovirgula sp.]